MKKLFQNFYSPYFLTVTSCQINQVFRTVEKFPRQKEFAWKEGIDSLKLKISGENLGYELF